MGEPASISEAEYPAWQQIPTRWKDNDIYGHVNNVEYYSMIDTLINSWLIRHGGLDIHSGTVIGVCVESQCSFHAAVSFPDAVAGGMRVSRLGSTSVTYQLGLFHADEGHRLATAEFVHVFVERHSRRPTPLGGDLRNALQQLVVA